MTSNPRDPRPRLVHAAMDSPIGRLTVVASERGVVEILWHDERLEDRGLIADPDDGSNPALSKAVMQLREYFDGRRQAFDLALDFRGTPFQQLVWRALLTIPFGETRSYGTMAALIGRPRAARAVGAANGQNPIPIIAPCHRVIGASGDLTGFGGGLDVKIRLLALEGVTSARWSADDAARPVAPSSTQSSAPHRLF